MTDSQKNTLPKNWELKTLGEVCLLKNGYAFKSDDYKEAGIPMIRISDINDNEIQLKNTVKVLESEDYQRFFVEYGDILIAMSGATTGKFGIYKNKEKAYQNQRVGNFQITNEKLLDKDFLYFSLHSLKRKIEADAYGGAQPNISSKKIEELQIPLPPLPEQQKIVQKIERLFTELETGTKALKTALNQLKIYRQAVLNHFLNDESWDRARLGEVCENVVDCLHSTAKFTDTGKFCIDTNSMVQGKILLEKARFVDEMTFNDRVRRLKPKEGDVFFSREGTVGLSAIVPADVDICLGQRMMMFRTGKSIIPSFFSFYLQSPLFERQYKPKISGTTVPHLNIRDTITFLIPLPPLEVQTQIVSEIEKRMTASDALEASLKSQLMNAENLRQSILKRAFEGKLV